MIIKIAFMVRWRLEIIDQKIMYTNRLDNSRGYVAIVSILIIAVLVVSIGTSATLTSINHLQNSFGSFKSQQTLYHADSCAEEVLWMICKNIVVPSVFQIDENDCNVNMISADLDNINFEVTSNLNNFEKRIYIEASSSATMNLVSWNLIE